MDFSDNYDAVLKQMNVRLDTRKMKHNINKNTPLLPFQSREPERVIFEKGFYRILGEFARIELNKKWDNNLNIDDLFRDIIESDEVEVEDDSEEYLKKLIQEYLFNEKDELVILNPYLFLYIPLSNNKRSKGQHEIALFIRDIFSKDNEKLRNFFTNKKTSHTFVKFILNFMPGLDPVEIPEKYVKKFDNIVNLFNEDINFAIDYDNFLIENIDKIFAYYYFFYISQLILKLSKGFDVENEDIDDLYFLLDWEKASKNRKTIDKGYNFLKEKNKSTFSRVCLIDQLNTLLGTTELLEKDMLDYYKRLDFESQKNLLHYLKKWTATYQYIRTVDLDKTSIDEYMINLPDDFKKLVNILYDTMNGEKGISKEPKSRYALNLDEICKKFFLKRRGSYGYIFNIDRDMLLVITALCVKDKKIKLNQLFEEYEKRGLFFDKHSKKEIINFLNKLNLIDKKSDSGDAQYVKPIL